MAKNGLITRKDIIEDEALRWGDEYAGEIKKAISAQNELLKSAREMVSIYGQFRKANTNSEFVAAKQAEAIATQQALNALKLEETAMISSEKIKKARLATLKEELNVQSQKDRALRNSTKLTLEERVQQQENNKVLRQAILEKMGMVGAYQKLNARRNEAQKTLANLLSAEVRNNAEIRKAQKEFDILDAKVKKVDATTKNYSKNVGNYSSAFSGMGANLSNLMGAFGVVGGVTAFASITKDIFQQTRELQSLELALKQVLGTSADLGETQMFLTRVADQYGVGIKELTRSYTQFYVSAKDKLSQQEINNIFESISKAAGAMGLSVEQQEGTFLALTQMLSKGTVQAEELRGQLSERLPGAFGILAKSMGVTEVELNKLMKDGKVIASEVLPEFVKQLEKAYGIENKERIESLNASTTRLSNTWTEFIASLEGDKGTVSRFFMFFIDMTNRTIGALTRLNKSWKDIYETAQARGESLAPKEFEKRMAAAGFMTSTETEKALMVMQTAQKEYDILVEQMNKKNKEIAESESSLFSTYWGRKNLKEEKEQLELDMAARFEIVKLAKKKIDELNNPKKKSSGTDELTKAELAALEKAQRDYERMRKRYIDGLKEEERNDFELRKNRIDYNSQANDEILKDDLTTLDQKLDALNENAQLDASLSRETLEHKLKMNALEKEGLEKLSVEKFNLYIKESDARIKLLMDEQLAVKDMTIAEKILYERAENDKIALLRKTEIEQQRIIDSEVAKFQTKLDSDKATQERLMNEAIEAENIRFKETRDLEAMNMADREKSIRDHEERIAHIKKQAALDLLKIQIDGLEKELAANDAKDEKDRVSAEIRKKIAEDLQKAKTDYTELDLQNHVDALNKKQLTEEEFNEKVKEMSKDLAYALADFANALFDRRIQNINDEISKNEEKYGRLIELAGNDAIQKDLLEQEAEKKRLELEKKKRKEQQKQAIFNKAIAVTEIGLKTAMAVVAALAVGPPQGYVFAALSGALGLAQLATVLATPIPKYEKGTKHHPGGHALVGERRPEVIMEPGKDPYIVRSQAILNLAKGTEVVPSIDEYNKLQRASFMASLQMEGKKVNDYQASQLFDQNLNRELLAELKENTRAVKNQRQNIIVNVPKIDIPHEIWKSKNTSWN